MTDSNLTAADLIDKIQGTINNSDTTVAGYLLSWLNKRYYAVLNKHKNWPFLQAEDTTTLSYTSSSVSDTLPADFKATTLVYDRTHNKNLARIELWMVRKNDPDVSNTATEPTHYYFTDEEGPAKSMCIYPALTSGSTATLSVVYQKELTPLTDSGSSIPLIPQRHRQNILENGVVSDYYKWKQQFEKAAFYESDYKDAVTTMEIEQGVTKANEDEDLCWRWDDIIPTGDTLIK